MQEDRSRSSGRESLSIAWRVILLIHVALTVAISAMMFISYPLGAYLVFHTSMGTGYREPLDGFYILIPLPVKVEMSISVGDLFILLWCTYLLLFTILLLSPKNLFSAVVISVRNTADNSNGSRSSNSNNLITTIAWFSILVASSVAIDLLQGILGIETGSLEYDDRLRHLVDATAAPLREELGFRVILIGIPVYLFLARQGSTLLSVLWRPYEYSTHRRSVYVLIVASALLFGLAHVLFSTGWSYGKVTQATVGGLILGWLYYRYGLHTAIIAHWAANYVPLTYLFAVDALGSDAMLNMLEVLLVSNGVVAILLRLMPYLKKVVYR
ncbi:MAG: CPBP family intramembrane metalloprotease [Candidatus Nitrosocaldus sp.]|nr:CPBP family intramembrane metalloprotease [Candidatus Nitrosocaldus sp.]MDW8000116.1 CPBP family intramembrane glutamic endopeptidase [Candidatus Nitrosocaldus sp.]